MEKEVQAACTDGAGLSAEARPEPADGFRVRATLTLRNAALVEAREARGWTQKRLAHEAGCSAMVICHAERLKGRHFSRKMAERIGAVLGISADVVRPRWSVETVVPTKIESTSELRPEHLVALASHAEERLLLPSPDEAAERSEEHRVLREAVGQLPEDLRATVVMYYFHGFGYDEIAEILEIHNKTVGSRLHVARSILREHVERMRLTRREIDEAERKKAVVDEERYLPYSLSVAKSAPPPTPKEARLPVCARGVEELNLGLRVARVLQNLQIRTIGDLTQTTAEQLLAQPNFGESSLKMVQARLCGFGLFLRAEPKAAPPPPEPLKDTEPIARLASRFPFSGRVWRALRQLEVQTVGDMRRLTVQDFFGCRGFGPGSMSELCFLLRENGISLRKAGRSLNQEGGA